MDIFIAKNRKTSLFKTENRKMAFFKTENRKTTFLEPKNRKWDPLAAPLYLLLSKKVTTFLSWSFRLHVTILQKKILTKRKI